MGATTAPDLCQRTKPSRNSLSGMGSMPRQKTISARPQLTRREHRSQNLCCKCTTAFLALSTLELSPSDPLLTEGKEIPERKNSWPDNKNQSKRKTKLNPLVPQRNL